MDKLQIFISWSGARAHSAAKAIKAWLPDVVRNAEPWLSSEDLQKGLQWLPELNKNLSSTAFGIIILTAENKNAPWLLFEAGVISKALPDKHCCPLLVDLKQTDISGPLAQFQGTNVSSKEDMMQLASTINEASGAGKIDDERLKKWFNMAWDDLSKIMSATISTKTTPTTKPGPSDRELLEEILQTTRRLAIEDRARLEPRSILSSAGIPLQIPQEALLRSYSELPPSAQLKLFELITSRQDSTYLEELLWGVNRHQRASLRTPEGSSSESMVSRIKAARRDTPLDTEKPK